MKAPCAKLMIFMTPNTMRSPAETMNRIAAVVTMSRTSVIIRLRSSCKNQGPSRQKADASRRLSPRISGLQIGALRPRIDIGEALDDLYRAVGLHLPEIHGERGVMLRRHHDRAARPFDTDAA